MKLSEALAAITAEYELGCVEYYSRMNPDPWQAAHDELQKHVGKSEEELDAAVDRFTLTIKNLEAAFRMVQPKDRPPSRPWTTGFYSPSPEVAAAREARVTHRCIDCPAERGLTLMRIAGKVTPICQPCAEARQKRG